MLWVCRTLNSKDSFYIPSVVYHRSSMVYCTSLSISVNSFKLWKWLYIVPNRFSVIFPCSILIVRCLSYYTTISHTTPLRYTLHPASAFTDNRRTVLGKEMLFLHVSLRIVLFGEIAMKMASPVHLQSLMDDVAIAPQVGISLSL